MSRQRLQAFLHTICCLGVTGSYVLPGNLAEVCPFSSFCGEKARSINISSGKETCCRSCSCDPNCGRRRNCCFYEDDLYRIEEKGESSCVAPININQVPNIPFGRYYMIDKCPGANDTCRSIKAAAWGNLFPHLSYKTGFIYYNQFCARCHNDSHIVPWTLEVMCPPLDDGEPSLSSFSYETEKIFLGHTSLCTLMFRAPNDIDLSSEFCNFKVISDCTYQDPSLEMDTFLKLKAHCHNFNATFAHSSFQSNIVFKNVYCYLCSKPYATATINDICPSNNYDDKNRVIPGNLMLLLGSYDADYPAIQDGAGDIVCHRDRKVKDRHFQFDLSSLLIDMTPYQ
ncbi:hypothetical protein DPMN_119356 [Dreissena polymorpha]|uniref:Uncharacterized protein n=1 Tax=Dreissena polymorpha TaxID=45954 RepID=A0A9D4GI51_DREPO|nr:hypothetical protein DPMN_119356 [Dreissena polymorpha]